MPPTGFEPAIAASERPQSHALDRPAIGIGLLLTYCPSINLHIVKIFRLCVVKTYFTNVSHIELFVVYTCDYN